EHVLAVIAINFVVAAIAADGVVAAAAVDQIHAAAAEDSVSAIAAIEVVSAAAALDGVVAGAAGDGGRAGGGGKIDQVIAGAAVEGHGDIDAVEDDGVIALAALGFDSADVVEGVMRGVVEPDVKRIGPDFLHVHGFVVVADIAVEAIGGERTHVQAQHVQSTAGRNRADIFGRNWILGHREGLIEQRHTWANLARGLEDKEDFDCPGEEGFDLDVEV